MAFFNSVLFLTLLVAISALMAAPSSVEANIVDVNNIIYVNGTVRCVVNTTLLPNGIPLANATVALKCGKSNTTVANSTTNANGTFTIVIDPPPPRSSLVGTLIVYLQTIKNCTAVVTTPLSTACNTTLPTNGTLSSVLTKGGIDRVGDRRIYSIRASSFIYTP